MARRYARLPDQEALEGLVDRLGIVGAAREIGCSEAAVRWRVPAPRGRPLAALRLAEARLAELEEVVAGLEERIALLEGRPAGPIGREVVVIDHRRLADGGSHPSDQVKRVRQRLRDAG